MRDLVLFGLATVTEIVTDLYTLEGYQVRRMVRGKQQGLGPSPLGIHHGACRLSPET